MLLLISLRDALLIFQYCYLDLYHAWMYVGLYVGLPKKKQTTVERDEETGELIRTQMVYVDEHACIGCTHCAMVAQSTFFKEPELGRARW